MRRVVIESPFAGASKYSFAYGGGKHNPDYVTEAEECAKFMFEHVEHGPVLIVYADDTPSTFASVNE